MGRRKEPRPGSPELSRRVWPGLEILLEAYRCAEDVGRDVWDFAVEIRALRAAGLTSSGIRWLVCKGYVAHGVELCWPDHDERKFRDAGKLKLHKRSCFVLTPAGDSFADGQEVLSIGELRRWTLPAGRSQDGDETPDKLVPKWDPARHELRVGGIQVKQFKLPSPNQEMVLTAFDEEGWPPRIDDPLPPKEELDPKERLHNTIKALNRNQKQRLLRIKGDGTGEGVMWEVTQDSQTKQSGQREPIVRE